jgi:hypothetical protein
MKMKYFIRIKDKTKPKQDRLKVLEMGENKEEALTKARIIMSISPRATVEVYGSFVDDEG